MYCNQCGAALAQDGRFCTSCGAQQQGAIAAPNAASPRTQLVDGSGNLEVQLMSSMDADQRNMFQYQMSAVRKSPGTASVLSYFGLSRFYLDQPGLAILQLLLCFFIVGLIWWFVDIFTARRRTREYNERRALQIAAAFGVTR